MFDTAWGDSEDQTAASREILERLVMACSREKLLPSRWEGSDLLLTAPGGEVAVFPTTGRYGMQRFDLADCSEGPALEAFLDRFFPHLPDARRATLLTELQNSYLNMALSLQALRRKGAGTPGEGSLADWEGRVWCGHPLHPGARLRSGLSREDNRSFGPEWQVSLNLPLLSVARESVGEVGDFAERLAGLFPSLEIRPDAERVFLPVHPWQAKNDLETRFAGHFDSGLLAWTGKSLPARPTMSFRSVILQTEVGESYHLKLPVAVQTTGATRTVSVAATRNGPLMSEFLSRLFAHPEMAESVLFRHLHLMGEPASFYLKDEDPDRSRYLSGILRRGPGDGSRSRWLLPAAALLEPRENPLFIRAARHFRMDPVTLLTSYCRHLIPAQAFLCGQLGIALEAHPQNIVVDFRGLAGSPPDIHFWYRDLGGIRLHPGRLRDALQKRGWDDRLEAPQFLPGSATSTESERDLSSKFVYSLLQNHLGELIRAVARSGIEERSLWKVVRGVLDEHRGLMGGDLEERVFASHWDLKAMWTMRMDSAVTEYTYQPVENPLA